MKILFKEATPKENQVLQAASQAKTHQLALENS